MDIFFTDPSDIPVPPDEVRIRQFRAEPWPDGRRIKIFLEVTPFQKRPSGEVTISDALGNIVANANIIETIDPKMELTMHLRDAEPHGIYKAAVQLFFIQEIEDEVQENEILVRPERIHVDSAETEFEIVN